MSEPKKPGLNFDISRQAKEALCEMHKSARAWTAENSMSISAMEIKRSEELKRLNPYRDIYKLLRPDAGIQAAIEALNQREGLAARLNVDRQATQEFSRHLDQYHDIAKQYEANFRLPHVDEAAWMLADMKLDGGAIAAYALQHMDVIASQRDLVASMSRPWIRETDAACSTTALMELHGLGSALRSVQGFDEVLTKAIRSDLGDWRDRISFPPAVFDDPVARTEFYVERGFNSSLTDFPEEAFQECLVRVGLDTDLQDGDEWAEVMHAVDPVEDAAFRRTNKCHNLLQRLERRLRQFIDAAMTERYGADWPKKRLPPRILESWERKKSQAESAGVVLTTFIEVADFTDYDQIICRKDHWRDVFQGRFKRQESVRESFQRLHPIRLATMHARLVTKEDELYVLAESRRLLGAIDS